MRIKLFFFAVLLMGSFGASSLLAQIDPQPGTGTPVAVDTIRAKVVLLGTRLNPGVQPIRCSVSQDTCAIVYYEATTATGTVGGSALNMYIPSDQRGFTKVDAKIATNYKETIISIIRSKDTQEVGSEQELQNLLRSEDTK